MSRIYYELYRRKLEKKLQKRKAFEADISKKRDKILLLKKEELALEESCNRHSFGNSEKERELEQAQKELAEITAQKRMLENQLSLLSSQVTAQAETKGLTQKEAKTQKYKLESSREELMNQKLLLQKSLQEKQGALDSKKLVHEQYLMLKNEASAKAIKEALQRKVDSLKSAAEHLTQSKTLIAEQTKAYTKDLKEKEAHIKSIKQQIDESKEENEKLISEMQDLEKEKNKAQTETLNTKITLTAAKQKLTEIQSEFVQLRKKLEVGLSDINVSGLIHLLEEAERANIEGVYGLFVDLIEVDETILYSIESLVKAKLFAIVVRDQKVASELIELNKKIKGPKIMIYPLNWSEEHKRELEYPSEQNAIIFERFVNIREEFEEVGILPLVRNIIGGNIMVKSLEEGHKFAKKYECNCITKEGEIVYAGGFLTRLGYTDVQNQKLKTYLDYRELAKELASKQRSFAKLVKNCEDLKEQELRAQDRLTELKLDRERLKLRDENLVGELVTFEKACIQLKKILIELEDRLGQEEFEAEQLKKEIQHLTSKDGIAKIDKFDEKKFKEVSRDIEQLGEELKEAMRRTEANNEAISLNDQETEKLAEAVHKDLILKKEFNSMEVDMMNLELKRVKSLLESLKKYEADRAAYFRMASSQVLDEKEKAVKQEEVLKSVKSNLEVDQLTLQIENQKKFDLQISIDGLQSKIVVLNVDLDLETRELKDLVPKSDKDLILKLKKLMLNKIKYTEKDKANFDRLEEYFRDLNEYGAELRDLKASKNTFLELMSSSG